MNKYLFGIGNTSVLSSTDFGIMHSNSPVKLVTHLSTDACQSRLLSEADEERLAFTVSGYRGSKPILAKVSGNRIRLQRRIFYGNPYRPYFCGQFIRQDGFTIIEGTFVLHPLVRLFNAIWFTSLLLYFFAIAGKLMVDQENLKRDSLIIATAILLACFAFAQIKFGQWLARHHRQTIIDFLTFTFESKVQTD